MQHKFDNARFINMLIQLTNGNASQQCQIVMQNLLTYDDTTYSVTNFHSRLQFINYKRCLMVFLLLF